ncbi:MAG: response regulator [Planctomycetales bacterium]|nr:response regulator [Planctomycetales bacterium]
MNDRQCELGESRSPQQKPAEDECELHVVGVGASAGGLEALEAFFAAMPVDTNAAFVVVQHLSPDFKSHMEQLLARRTTMPIYRVENQMSVEPNSIYLIPPKKEMIIAEGKLLLKDKDPTSLAHPIDQFFRSLANDRGKYAIAVVLSGTGSDGSRGIRDIHENGGLVLAQSEDTAKFDGMPLNAQQTGLVDVVLAPGAMAAAITTYIREVISREQLAEQELPREQLDSVNRVFRILRSEFGLDFSHYKPSTIARRMNRRLELNGYTALEAYIERLQEDRAELNDLYRDLLIGVTRFFRDTEAFAVLEKEIVPSIIRSVEPGKPIRAWVAGCATGEEAYSIAMLFHEQLTAGARPIDFKMFATDVHRVSIQTAAAGVYPVEAIAEVSESRRERYFREKRDGFHVTPELRQMIVFAPHNVISDAPFTQLDLVTCRNLLIYLQPAAQKKALSLFHFSLRTGGTLVLGPSETPGEIADEFETVNKRWKIYCKRRDVRLPPEMRLPLSLTTQIPRGLIPRKPRSTPYDNQLLATYDRLLEQFMPPSFLVDENFDLVHTFGGAERYLEQRGGRTTTSLADLVHDDLRASLSGALQHAVKDDSSVRYSGVRIQDAAGNPAQVHLTVQPLHDPRTKVMHLLVSLEQAESAPNEPGTVDDEYSVDELTQEHIRTLETELRFTRENLQATIEELETANEELQATNEELVASNEELQSTNEELHSVNEELYTVNTEHQSKIEELTEANDDMDNLLETTRVGVVFLDHDLCIRRFTPEIGRVLDLLPHDIGRRVDSFTHHLRTDQLLDTIRRVRDTSKETEVEVADRRDRNYLVRILPYRTRTSVQGVVLTLIDISERKRQEQKLHASLQQYQLALEAGQMGAWEWNIQTGEVHWSDDLYRVFGVDPQSFQPSREGFLGFIVADDRQRVERVLNDAVSQQDRYSVDTQIEVRGEVRSIRARGRVERDSAGRAVRVIGVCWDNTQEQNNAARLTQLAAVVENTNDFVGVLDRKLQIIALNRAARTMLGIDASQDLPTLTLRDIHPTATWELIRDEAIPTARKSGIWTGETEIVTPAEQPMIVSQSLIAHVNDEGAVTHFSTIARDITARRRVEEALRLRDRAVSAATNGIVIVDATQPDFPIIYANQGFEQITGYTAAEAYGRNCRFLQGEETSRDAISIIHQAVDAKRDCQVTLANYRKDGSLFWNDLHITPVRNDQGTVTHFIGIQNDVTSRKRFERRLRDAEQNATAASQAKTAFLANVSHELRTPLTAILGFAEMLQQRLRNTEDRDAAETIRRNGGYLLEIVNDILDLSKVEADRMEIREEDCDLYELLSDVYKLMKIRADQAGIPLELKYQSLLPRTIHTDRTRLRQILVNLLSNAIKFTEEGQVTLSVEYIVDDDAGDPHGTLEFKVIDTGIGMTEETQAKLFRPFSQADFDVTQRFGGTGLGLSISKRLSDRLRARLAVSSELGRGSMFTLSLPLDRPCSEDNLFDPHTRKPTQSRVAEEKLPRLSARVLVADDRRDVWRVCKYFLEQAGATVDVAEDGQQAVEHVVRSVQQNDAYDVVLMDMQMPILTGYQATTKLRELGFEAPIVALTAGAMKGDRERCLEAGCTDYFAKPINGPQLVKLVHQYGHDSRPPASPVRILVVDDSPDVARLMSHLLTGYGHTVATATNADDALKIAQDLQADVILLDLRLPDMDGFELKAKLDALIPTDQTRHYIAISGLDAKTIRSRAGEAGFYRFFVKPVDPSELQSAISERNGAQD